MASPVFWLIAAGIAVFLCTSHLFLGIAIGRKMTCRDAERQTREALTIGISQSLANESSAQSVLDAIERAIAMQSSGASTKPLEAELSTILRGVTVLRDALHDFTTYLRKSLGRLSRARPSPSRTTLGAVRGEASTDRERDLDYKPWSSLSVNEVEHYRTGDATADDEQRPDVRYPYCIPQFVAPVHGNRFPSPTEFEAIVCRNISRRGISFFATELPESQDLIVTLGQYPQLIFMRARITNHRSTCLDGKTGHTIGCEFVARLAPGIYRWNEERHSIDAATEAVATVDEESG